MVKALVFKGDKKPRKRKRTEIDSGEGDAPASKELVTATNTITEKDQFIEDDDSWVSAEASTDISGPTILALPTEPTTCIASDPNGKVFPLAIENMVEGDPGTAEPHDVRQVWIANRVAGTESFTFKGHHGKYLGCNKAGILSATREAVSAEESFTIVQCPEGPGFFAVQTARDKFLTVDDDKQDLEVRGDADAIGFTTTFRIRMQARFKPKRKAAKEERARDKISRKELEDAAGRKLNDDEVKKLKRARKEGTYHEALLDVKVKGKHDKYA
ncbi:MAG: hypothetical protein M1820_006030 [Bogoriella megaspora]|nr:MAG: hypothetical protein M1820_006030 [Bogoriella megaspora]